MLKVGDYVEAKEGEALPFKAPTQVLAFADERCFLHPEARRAFLVREGATAIPFPICETVLRKVENDA